MRFDEGDWIGRVGEVFGYLISFAGFSTAAFLLGKGLNTRWSYALVMLTVMLIVGTGRWIQRLLR